LNIFADAKVGTLVAIETDDADIPFILCQVCCEMYEYTDGDDVTVDVWDVV
jgi:hypothetical protein